MHTTQTSKPLFKIKLFLSQTQKFWFWSSCLIFLYEAFPIFLAYMGLFNLGMPLFFLHDAFLAYIENPVYGDIASIRLMIYICPITSFLAFYTASNRTYKIIAALLCLQAILQLIFWTLLWSAKL